MVTGPADPDEIAVSRERREMQIQWRDGHASRYPFDLLRRECPCALCNDERQSRAAGAGLTLLQGPVLRPGEVQATEVKPVGRYALSVTWSDGHDAGIYSYTFLRGLCPCSECRPRRAGS